MPSGAKKRKAAKKKQGKDANTIHPEFHSQGDDVVKTHDEKDSDGGEVSGVSSPMSQDNHSNQHQFTEGGEEEVEKREGASSARAIVLENESIEGLGSNGESLQKVVLEEDGVVQIDSNLKPEDDSESKNIIIQFVELLDKSSSSSDDGSSSSSSSDDESHVVEKNVVVVESGQSKEEAYSPVLDAASFVDDTIKPVDSSSKVETQVNDIPVEGPYNSVVETAPIVESDKVSLAEDVVQVTESSLVVECVSSDVVESELKENAEKILPSEDKSAEDSSIHVYLGSQKKEDKMVSTSDENAAETSDAMGFAAQEEEEKLALSFNAARDDNGHAAECIKEPEIPECSDKQPPATSTLPLVKANLWKGCCGMFEVLTGSNR